MLSVGWDDTGLEVFFLPGKWSRMILLKKCKECKKPLVKRENVLFCQSSSAVCSRSLKGFIDKDS